jgi:5-methylcytosine-specific restriction endonuclease McrA
MLLIKGRVEVVNPNGSTPSEWNEYFTFGNGKIKVPATLRLLNRVHKKWKVPRFRKKVLFNRDSWSCQYCGKKLTNDTAELEHVLPSSRGGATSWLNCVAACTPCNKFKANKTPDEAGMKLIKKPSIPTALHFWDLHRSNVWHNDWAYFIDPGAFQGVVPEK